MKVPVLAGTVFAICFVSRQIEFTLSLKNIKFFTNIVLASLPKVGVAIVCRVSGIIAGYCFYLSAFCQAMGIEVWVAPSNALAVQTEGMSLCLSCEFLRQCGCRAAGAVLYVCPAGSH